jgi:alpha-1,3-rhamnosyltransferase
MIAKAKGTYIIFISCDDVLNKNAISNAVNKLDADDNLCFVGGGRVFFMYDDNNKKTKTIEENKDLGYVNNGDPDALLESEYTKLHSFFMQGTVFRKKIVDAIGGFDEDMTGDDIVFRIKIARYIKNNPPLTFEIGNFATFLYRQHETNLNRNTIRQIKTIFEVMERYFDDRPFPGLLIDWINGAIAGGKEKELGDLIRTRMMDRNISLVHRARIAETFFALYSVALIKVNSRTYRYAQRIRKIFRKIFPKGSLQTKIARFFFNQLKKIRRFVVKHDT